MRDAVGLTVGRAVSVAAGVVSIPGVSVGDGDLHAVAQPLNSVMTIRMDKKFRTVFICFQPFFVGCGFARSLPIRGQ